MDGVETWRAGSELLPDTRVLMLAWWNEQDAIVRSVAAGATGYLQKYSGKEQQLTTLREVALGKFRIPGNAARRPTTVPSGWRLSPTAREILRLFAGGLSYQEIGEVREISALTVLNAVSGVQKNWGSRPGSRWCSGRCAPAWWTAVCPSFPPLGRAEGPMSRGIQDAGRLKPKPGPASRCGPASEQGDFSLPPLPAVQRRRNPVPAPHRNRAGYDSRGQVSVTHLVDERGYSVMLNQRDPEGVWCLSRIG